MRISPVSYVNSYRSNNIKNTKNNNNNVSFGRYATFEAEKRARDLLTEPGAGYQPCLDTWFEGLGISKEVTIFINDQGILDYEYRQDIANDDRFEYARLSKKGVKDANDRFYLQAIFESLVNIKKVREERPFVEFDPELKEYFDRESEARDRALQQMRLDAHAK